MKYLFLFLLLVSGAHASLTLTNIYPYGVEVNMYNDPVGGATSGDSYAYQVRVICPPNSTVTVPGTLGSISLSYGPYGGFGGGSPIYRENVAGAYGLVMSFFSEDGSCVARIGRVPESAPASGSSTDSPALLWLTMLGGVFFANFILSPLK